MASKRCGAKTPNGPCRAWGMPNGRCWRHGGKTPVGIASPNFKHGAYSEHLPVRMRDRYQAELTNPEIFNLRKDIALTTVRIEELLERVDTGESGRLWKQLRETAAELKQAQRRRDVQTVADLLPDLIALIDRGYGDWAAWEDVFRIGAKKASLISAERARLRDMALMVPVSQMMMILQLVLEVIKRHVDDPDALSAIAAEFSRLMGRGPDDGPDTAS